MKRTGQCPKCQSTRVGYFDTVPDVDTNGITASFVGFTSKVSGTIIKVRETVNYGLLEAYVCTECGFYETYVKDPREVPYSQLVGFRFVNAGR